VAGRIGVVQTEKALGLSDTRDSLSPKIAVGDVRDYDSQWNIRFGAR